MVLGELRRGAGLGGVTDQTQAAGKGRGRNPGPGALTADMLLEHWSGAASPGLAILDRALLCRRLAGNS